MKVKIWGARGSIATPLSNAELAARTERILHLAAEANLSKPRDVGKFISTLPWHLRQTAGGDSTCMEVEAGGSIIILDAGSGIRRLGLDLMRRFQGVPIEAHVLISHTHWDHISGFPFFIPAYLPTTKLSLYSPHTALQQRFERQQASEYFPVPLKMMASEKRFVQLKINDEFSIGDVEIKVHPLNHPGGCYGYRITYEGKSLVYATDSEYKDMSAQSLEPYIKFFRDAELLIFDAQYSMVENVEKTDWGHSNAFTGIDMALEAGVKRLALTHHEPGYDDEKICDMYQDALDYKKVLHKDSDLEIMLAIEGLVIEL